VRRSFFMRQGACALVLIYGSQCEVSSSRFEGIGASAITVADRS
jgi:hypothetical protein